MSTLTRLPLLFTYLLAALAIAAFLTGCDWGTGSPGSSGPFNL